MIEHRAHSRRAAIACAMLLLVYFLLAWLAVRTKSPTYDETLHTLSSQVALHMHDYRMDFDNPPLWKYWAALANGSGRLQVDTTLPQWTKLPDDIVREWFFEMHTLYRMPQNDPDTAIARSRFMMLLLAVAVGAIIARWSWQLAGGSAAIAATLLFAFDPNFLAHGPLVKNDVIVATLLTALAFGLWRLGQRITIGRVFIVALLCGAGCAVKFSGILLPVIAGVVVVARGVMGEAWVVCVPRGRTRGDGVPRPRRDEKILLASRSSRLSAALGLCGVFAIGTILVIWASYGWRFSVVPEAGVQINTSRIIANVAHSLTGHGEALSAQPPLGVRTALWALRHRLLPEAWLNGLLVIYAGTQSRPSFLLGQYSDTGWLSYYPLAMLFKTPVATLAAMVIAAVAGFSRKGRSVKLSAEARWSMVCVAVPPTVYFVAAILTPAAVGLRHILPIYPFIFIACGVVTQRLWASPWGRSLVILIALGLIVETLAVFPNYIPFFNIAVGGERGGILLLSDSNLDWGQDLPLLARWQRAHPDQKLYLCYFGTADPSHYGIKYVNLPGGYILGPPPEMPAEPGVIAISATELQGVFSTPQVDTRAYYAPLRKREPMEVLGGSIYLYDFPEKGGKR